jgi:hypothetical protein
MSETRPAAGADNSIFFEWPLNRHEHLRVALEQFKGVDLAFRRRDRAACC